MNIEDAKRILNKDYSVDGMVKGWDIVRWSQEGKTSEAIASEFLDVTQAMVENIKKAHGVFKYFQSSKKELSSEDRTKIVDENKHTIEAIGDVLEIMRKDFHWDEAPGYVKRNFIRQVYGVAISAANDNTRSMLAKSQALNSLKTMATAGMDPNERGGK